MREFELEPGEHVTKEVRKHWLVFVISLLPYVFLALIPLALPALFKLVPGLNPYVGGFRSPIAHLLLGTYWLLVWSTAFMVFTRYYLNLWVVTNQRIIEIKQRGFFNRQVSSLLLNRIEDITIVTVGLLPSLLDIGNINVQTAGTEERFTMWDIPEPGELRDLITRGAASHPLATTAVE